MSFMDTESGWVEMQAELQNCKIAKRARDNQINSPQRRSNNSSGSFFGRHVRISAEPIN